MKELNDIEKRFERAFREQTEYLSVQMDKVRGEMHAQRLEMSSQTRWLVGVMITMTIAIIVAMMTVAFSL